MNQPEGLQQELLKLSRPVRNWVLELAAMSVQEEPISCDPTSDSPDPVVTAPCSQCGRLLRCDFPPHGNAKATYKHADVRVCLELLRQDLTQAQREVAELRAELATRISLQQSLGEIYTIANLTKELDAIRDVIHALNPMLSDGPLPYRVKQLCDDLAATRRERDEAREQSDKYREERDDNAHVIIEAGIIPGCDCHCRCDVCRCVVKAMDEAGFICALETDERWWDESEGKP